MSEIKTIFAMEAEVTDFATKRRKKKDPDTGETEIERYAVVKLEIPIDGKSFSADKLISLMSGQKLKIGLDESTLQMTLAGMGEQDAPAPPVREPALAGIA